MICWNCSTDIDCSDKARFRDTCPQCGSYVHCCLNCRFYSKQSSDQCREPLADRVGTKENANYCEYFEPNTEGPVFSHNRAEEAKQKLEDLFKH